VKNAAALCRLLAKTRKLIVEIAGFCWERMPVAQEIPKNPGIN
jgi:hypothetical protein